MKYVRLGRTGLEVSRICLGCMSFGNPNRGSHSWSLPEEQSRPILRAAWDAGINFFDTANVYSLGSSEEIIGKVLKEFAPRDELVIATAWEDVVVVPEPSAALLLLPIAAVYLARLRRRG